MGRINFLFPILLPVELVINSFGFIPITEVSDELDIFLDSNPVLAENSLEVPSSPPSI